MTARSGVAAAAAAVLVALAACRSGPRTPQAPPKPHEAKLEALRPTGDQPLQPYLDAYPLGDKGTRVDLLATTPQRSMHLVQTRRAIPRHQHPTRTEIVYVLTGTGTCFVGEKSYPITPGATFRIAPGVVHTAIPDEGKTIVAVSYFEPPLPEGTDDRVLVDEKR